LVLETIERPINSCCTKFRISCKMVLGFLIAVAGRPAALRVVGRNGQISLGKQYAGRHVLVEESEQGFGLSAPPR